MLDIGLATESEIRHTLCGRLRAQRLVLGLSQVELAQRAGVGLVTLQRLERGLGCTLPHFLQVVMALGLVDDLADLFSRPVQSIAQMEHKAAGRMRQRAPRRMRHVPKPGHDA